MHNSWPTVTYGSKSRFVSSYELKNALAPPFVARFVFSVPYDQLVVKHAHNVLPALSNCFKVYRGLILLLNGVEVLDLIPDMETLKEIIKITIMLLTQQGFSRAFGRAHGSLSVNFVSRKHSN